MRIYKTDLNDKAYKQITVENFETDTNRKKPWYQNDLDLNASIQYAICPACHHPIEIVGLYRPLKNTEKPYGRHSQNFVEGVGIYRPDQIKYCSLYRKRQKITKSCRKKEETEIEKMILELLVNNFDQVAFHFEEYTGIRMTDNLAEAMLKEYAGGKGFMYRGANILNVPWIFAFMSNSQNLWGRAVTDEELQKILLEKVKGATIEKNKQFKTAKYQDITFAFIHHNSRMQDNDLIETFIFRIVDGKQKTIYQKKIQFDHERFQDLITDSTKIRPRKESFVNLAKKYLMPEDLCA